MNEKLNELLILLCRIISTRKLYFTNHPKLVTMTSNFRRELAEFCGEKKSQKLFFGIIDKNIVYEGRNLVGPSIVGHQLILFAEKLHCGGISFPCDMREDEFKEFISLAADLAKPLATLQEARTLLAQKGINGIELAHRYVNPAGPIGRDQQSIWQGQDSGNFVHSPTLIYQALFDAVAQAHGDAVKGTSIDMDSARTVSEYMLQFTRTQFSDLMQHVHYPDFDSYIVGHSVRVAALAVYFANSFRWGDQLLLEIGTAALLHDIGKSKVPEEIIYKPGKLSREEFAVMMEHPQTGAQILMGQRDVTKLDIAAAWGHHIRNDGSGYPEHPSWAIRHPLTQLLQICDAFEALTAARPYKPTLSPHMAYCIMLRDKGGFHPALLASFISALGLYPPGNVVGLSNGSQGVVVKASQQIDRPSVRLTHTRDGTELGSSKQLVLDLSQPKYRNISVDSLIFN